MGCIDIYWYPGIRKLGDNPHTTDPNPRLFYPTTNLGSFPNLILDPTTPTWNQQKTGFQDTIKNVGA